MPRFLRLRPEAIPDVAAEGLNIKISRRVIGKLQPDIAAHRLPVDLRIGTEREVRALYCRIPTVTAPRGGVPSVIFASPLTVVTSVSAFPPVNTTSPLTVLTSMDLGRGGC